MFDDAGCAALTRVARRDTCCATLSGVANKPRRHLRGAHGSVATGAFTGLTIDEAVHAAKSAPPFNSRTPSRGGRDLALGREITDKAGVSFWSTVGSIEILHIRWAGLTGSFSRCSCHNRRWRALDLFPGGTRRDRVGEADVARTAMSSAAFSDVISDVISTTSDGLNSADALSWLAQYLRPLEPEELGSMENENDPELPVPEISRQDSAASSFDINV